MIAGGVESMSRAPFVMAKAELAFSRGAEIDRHHDRLALRESEDESDLRHRLDAGDRRERRRGMDISREDQDAFAFRSQQRAAARRVAACRRDLPVTIPSKKGSATVVRQDEHPRPDTTLEASCEAQTDREAERNRDSRQRSGINDGAGALCSRRKRLREARTDSAGAGGRFCGGRRCATRHGHRARSGGAQVLAKSGLRLSQWT